MSEVTRRPIKIRQSIHKEYCECWNTQVMSMNSIPYTWSADNMSLEELGRFLQSHTVVTTALFEEIDMDKISLCLSHGVAVTVVTNKVLTPTLIDRMSAVPRCSIQTSIEFLQSSIRNSLSPNSSEPFALLQMMHAAKAKKVYQILEVCWYPHLMNKFDLFETIDMYKNYVNHLVLRVPPFSDLVYRAEVTRWQALGLSNAEKFKHFYEPDIQGRSWKVRDKYREEIISELVDFIKSKKLSIEYTEWDSNSHRVRHKQSGTAKHPTGISNTLYQKGEDGKFILNANAEESGCPTCGKTLFL